jgi:hypothetical protein
LAADFIAVNRSKQLGNNFVRLASMLLECRQLAESLVASGNHCFDGSDYTVFEAQFGLAPGAGANTMNLLGLVRGVLNTDDDIVGANRKAWLDEFTARVAGQ